MDQVDQSGQAIILVVTAALARVESGTRIAGERFERTVVVVGKGDLFVGIGRARLRLFYPVQHAQGIELCLSFFFLS